MNSARKIERAVYPPYRRHSDRVRTLSLAMQQVEREHNGRLRRMAITLGAAAVLLLINGVVVTQLL